MNVNVSEDIIEKVKSLPKDNQLEVLDFIDLLSKKVDKEERKQWSQFSLEKAMRGLETEDTLYTIEDIKEEY